MWRGVTAACLTLLICHGLCQAQEPVSVLPGAEFDTGLVSGPIGETVVPGRGGFSTNTDTLIPGCQVWFGVEYLMFFTNGSRVPVPLVTSGITDNPVSGALGETGTQILLGNQVFNTDTYHGMRVRLGFDISDTGFGLEGIGFLFDQQETTVGYPSATVAPSVMGIPFISQQQDTEAVALINFPSTIEGTIDYKIRTNISGYEVNLGYACNTWLVDWGFVGYRYLNLTEGLFMTSNFRALDDGVITFEGVGQPTGAIGTISDSFRTKNEFYGGQFGAVKRLLYRNVAFELRTAVGFGNTRQRVMIDGSSSANGGAAVEGGLFAQSSNIGTTVRNQFSVVPEVGASIFVQLCDNFVGFVGYNFLFWNNVARPGYEIDRRVNLSQAPFGPTFSPTAQPPQPAVLLHRSQDLILHGLNAGFAVQF